MAQKTPGALVVASSASASDQLLLWQSGVLKTVTVALTQGAGILKADELGFDYPITSPASATLSVVFNNRNIGTVLGVDMRMVSGSCTATWRIADQGGANPTNITGLAALSVTTSLLESSATGARVMLKTGAVDRELQLVLASVSGAGPLLTAVRYTRA
jgi:hypothetical protein